MVHVSRIAPVNSGAVRTLAGSARLSRFCTGALRVRARTPVVGATSLSGIGASLAAVLLSCGYRAGTLGMRTSVFGSLGDSFGHFVSPYLFPMDLSGFLRCFPLEMSPRMVLSQK
jgi:hypothetical protein